MRIAQALGLDAGRARARRFARRRRFIWLKRRISEEEVEAIRALVRPEAQPLPVRGLTIEGEGHRFYPEPRARRPAARLRVARRRGQGRPRARARRRAQAGTSSRCSGLRDRSGRLIFSRGHRGRASARGARRLPHHRPGHPVHGRARARRGGADLRGQGRLGRRARSRTPARSSRWPTRLATTPTTTATSEVEARRDRALDRSLRARLSTMKIFTLAAALAARTRHPHADRSTARRGRWRSTTSPIHDTHVNEWLTPDADPRDVLEHRRGEDRARPRRVSSSTRRFAASASASPPASRCPGEASGVLRARGRPWVQVETADGVVRAGHQRDDDAAGDGGVARSPTAGACSSRCSIKRVTDGTGAVGARRGPARSARSGLAQRRAHARRDDGRGHRRRGHRRRGGDPWVPRGRQDRDRAEGRSRDRQVHRRSVHVVVHRFRSGRAPAHRGGHRARRAGSRASGRIRGRSGVPTHRRDEPSLPGSYPQRDPARRRSPRLAASPIRPTTTVRGAAQGAGRTRRFEELATPSAPTPAGAVRVPDMKGCSVREAAKAAIGLGLVPSIDGTGTVSRQDPPAGAVLPKGSNIKLVLRASHMMAPSMIESHGEKTLGRAGAWDRSAQGDGRHAVFA